MLYLDQNIDSTRIYFLKSQKLAKTSVDKYNIAHGWFYFYHKLNQVNNMNKYADLTIAYTDSVISEYEIEQMSKIQTVYNYSRWESIATQKEYETREARFTLYIYGISTFLVILLLCLFFVLYKKKVNRERKLKKEQISIIKQQIYTNNIEITKERKKLETARKEKSIMADEILQKEAKINSLVNEINALNEGVDLQENNIEGTKNKELISNRAIVIKFKQLVEYKKNATDNQWKTLENVFYYFHPQFRKTLEKNKALNENEFRVCMLVWLHFTPSQLTVLMGMSSSNVSNIRKRMASKIFGEEMTTSKFDKKIQEMA